MLYMQVASQKSALSRENMQLQEKLTKKKEKMKYTEKQLELTIRQFDATRNEK